MFIELEPIFNNIGMCIEAQATVEVSTDCDRCASSIDRVFTVPVSHTLVTSLNNEENDELILVEDMHFELDPLVREDVFLFLPNKILCKEDCKGVCQFCGANLNEGDCGCAEKMASVDAATGPFAALAGLRLDGEDGDTAQD